MGANADWWGGTPEENTCHAHNKAKPSRIDGIVANMWMVPLIHEVKVNKDEHIPSHSIFQMTACNEKRDDERKHLRKSAKLKSRFDKLMTKMTEGMEPNRSK